MVGSAWGVLELTQNEPIANPGDTHANMPPIEVNAPLPVPGYTNLSSREPNLIYAR